MLQGTEESATTPAEDSAEGDPSDGPPRYCSVKGCKAVIPGSYEYKMCPSCRTRYRGYGITKRKKWKAERQAFEHEMGELRRAEDERRKANGLPVGTDIIHHSKQTLISNSCWLTARKSFELGSFPFSTSRLRCLRRSSLPSPKRMTRVVALPLPRASSASTRTIRTRTRMPIPPPLSLRMQQS